MRSWKRNNLVGWGFVAPAVSFLLVFMVYPILRTFYLSFTKYNFVYDAKPKSVGLGSYAALFSNSDFLRSIANTFYFALVYIVLVFVLGLLIGLLLSNRRLFSSDIAKVVVFIPMVIPVSMSSFMFLFMLDPQYGLVNGFLKDYLHLSGLVRDWMNNTSTALNVIIVVTLWQGIGFISLLFLAGIQSVPESMNEAAIIDGAGPIRRVVSVLLPNLKPTYQVVGILAIISSIKLFAQVVAMTGTANVQTAGGPANSTLTMYVETWKTGFGNYDMGLASAMGYFMSAVVLVLFGLNFLINRTERE